MLLQKKLVNENTAGVNPLPNTIQSHALSIDKSFIIHRSRRSKDDQDVLKTVEKKIKKSTSLVFLVTLCIMAGI